MVERHFGIRGAHLLAVARELYLRHYGYAFGLGVFHQALQLILRIIAAKATLAVAVGTHVAQVLAILLFRLVPPFFPCLPGAPSAHLGESWIGFYLHAPSGRVGQVEVERVETVMAHDVNLAIQFVERHEMAAHVDHHSAPWQWLGLTGLGKRQKRSAERAKGY